MSDDYSRSMMESFSRQVQQEQTAREEMRRRQEELAGRFDARDIYNHLLTRVREFEANLDNEWELGVKLANFGVAAEIHVRHIGYTNPNIVEFGGLYSDGAEVLLTQHISQLNFLLIKLPPLVDEEPYRVGFR